MKNLVTKIALLLTLATALTACGSEPMDGDALAVALPGLNSDMIPLSSFHGHDKDLILQAKAALEVEGMTFGDIYVEKGQTEVEAKTLDMTAFENVVVLSPDVIKGSTDEAYFARTALLLTREWANSNDLHLNAKMIRALDNKEISATDAFEAIRSFSKANGLLAN